MVSSLVVIFAVVEVLILPFLAQTFLWQEPLVAGAWIGLAASRSGRLSIIELSSSSTGATHRLAIR